MLSLRYQGRSTIPIEVPALLPENLVGKSLAEIARLPVQHGNAEVRVGEFFTLSGSSDDEELLIEGDCGHIKSIGSGMTRGRIVVRGNVGMHLGAEMTGGRIEVFGNAGDWAGAEMRGGCIQIHGNAGDLVGGAYRGSAVGMRGGEILVDGNAGHEIGCAMRRGLIAVGGGCGDFAGASMIAGSVLIFGKPGERTGAGMKRGTIVCAGDVPVLLPTFREDCVYRPVFVNLYLRQLRTWGFAVPERLFQGNWRRHSGDLVALGKGEVLHWCEEIRA